MVVLANAAPTPTTSRAILSLLVTLATKHKLSNAT
jgi:hypothetical protein